ncbi:MAG: amino acid ABC transporter substrate-binding protein, partial [Actinomycetota bacterium]|nr:amino acid ABC transporter substrate-binding protein [Actinomycetota bacterium]
MKRLAILLFALGLVLAACNSSSDDTTTTTAADSGATETTTAPAPASGSMLQTVQDRGTLNCGVNDAVPGFGYTDAEGNFAGFDIDYCRAVAAAVLGDAEAVTYRPLTAQQRFTALQSGEIDVLIRNTTFTSSRDGREGATFLTSTFYDGQGMMVYADSGITSIDDMADLSVCVLSGTTTELNLAARFGSTPYTPLTFDANDQLQAAFVAGQCDGWTSDKSQLAGVRSNFPDSEGGPEGLVILDETFSKEPLGPVVVDGDSQWAQAVNWVVLATIQAEEWDLTSANVSSYDSDDAAIRRFLGLEITTDEG